NSDNVRSMRRATIFGLSSDCSVRYDFQVYLRAYKIGTFFDSIRITFYYATNRTGRSLSLPAGVAQPDYRKRRIVRCGDYPVSRHPFYHDSRPLTPAHWCGVMCGASGLMVGGVILP